jgi:uroporphyrinogen-III decarboxylase
MLAHNVMNKKQFERFYWPHMKELLDAYAEKGMNVRIFTEGSILRFAEYFKDYPKGTLTFHIEQDDPFQFREALPNVAIMGGMTTDLLSNGTPDECVAYAKRLCDELGKDGGFIFSEGKMLSYRNDAKRENMKAVCDFVSSYRM